MSHCCEIDGLEEKPCRGTTTLDLVRCLNSLTGTDILIYCIERTSGGWIIYYKRSKIHQKT